MSKAVISDSKTARHVKMEGELDISNLPVLREPLNRLLDADPIDYDIVLNLQEVRYIDSAVLEVIVRSRNKLKNHDRALVVVTRGKSQPDHVLRMCRFDTILDLRSIHEDPEIQGS